MENKKVFCQTCKHIFVKYGDCIITLYDALHRARRPSRLERIEYFDDPDCYAQPKVEIVPDSFLSPAHEKIVAYIKCKERNKDNNCPFCETLSIS